MPEGYTATEVAWLLSISYEEALGSDADPADSWPDLISSNYHSGSTGASDEVELFAVLRWHDVRTARERASARIDAEILTLRLEGLTEHQIAVVLDRSQQTVSRLFRGALDEVLVELGQPS